MSAHEALSQHQFVEHLYQVPPTPSSHLSSPKQQVRMVPTTALHHAYSGEYDVPGHGIEEARSARLAAEAHYPEHLRHPGDVPGAQEALEASVAKHGIKEPLLLSQHISETRPVEFGITNGSHRLLAAQRLGLEHVPVVVKF